MFYGALVSTLLDKPHAYLGYLVVAFTRTNTFVKRRKNAIRSLG
jgi:hypothetical protein